MKKLYKKCLALLSFLLMFSFILFHTSFVFAEVPPEQRVAKYESDILKYEQEIEKLDEKYDNGLIDESSYNKKVAEYEEKIRKAEKDINKIESDNNTDYNGDNSVSESDSWLNFDIGQALADFLEKKIDEGINSLHIFGKALTNNVIFPEREITVFSTVYDFLHPIVLSITLSLILLSALKYGFDVYILWRNGNPEENPIEIIVRYLIAVALIFSFSEIYAIAGNIIVELLEKIEEAFVGVKNETATGIIGIDGVKSFLGSIVFGIVFLYQYLLALFNTLKKGIELFILRLGFPLACINVIQPQGSTFNAYVSTFIKDFLLILVNMVILNLSLTLRSSGGYGAMWGIAGLLLLNNSGQLLSQFIIPNQGGGGGLIGSAINQAGGSAINSGLRGAGGGIKAGLGKLFKH